MRTRTLSLALLSLAFAAPAGAVSWDDARLGVYYDPDDADDQAVHDAARAVVSFGNATGFLVSPAGHILTNYHVYDGWGDEGTVRLAWTGQDEPRRLSIRFVAADAEHDVAIYQVVGTTGLPYIPLRTRGPVVGEDVFVVGHPDSDPMRVSYGSVLEDHVTIGGRPSVEYSAQTWWGSSGSPVVDRDGNAIALHWGWDSKGLSHGRLTGVPFDVMAREVPEIAAIAARWGSEAATGTVASVCSDPDTWRVGTTLVERAVAINASGRTLDRVRLNLQSAQPRCAAYVADVSYALHPTFTNPWIAGDHERSDHPATLKTWGSFDTVARVELISGEVVAVPGRVSW